MSNKAKYVAAFLAAFLLQMWFDVAAYAANNKVYTLGLAISFTYPLIAMVPTILIVEARSAQDRVKIALMEGVGYTVATGVFLVVRDWT
jgi:hypothetical protein